MNDVYRKKVELLLRILPFVTDEECFAVHGGTAINLFVKNLSRLSVDIDVTYIPLEDRSTSLNHINEALMRIADKARRSFRDIRIIPRLDICKITCERQGCQVKIEVNQTKRGLVCGDAKLYPLCEKAQSLFVWKWRPVLCHCRNCMAGKYLPLFHDSILGTYSM